MKKISILHPSWKRPDLAYKCYHDWMNKADYPSEIEYILCLSEKDPHLPTYITLFQGRPSIQVVTIPDNGLIIQVNHAAKYSTANLIVDISDDFSCPENWDTQLLTALEGKSDYLVKTNDGQQPWIITLPIMDRAYYNARGYIYHPSTKHMFCDTWITHEAHLMGKVITLPLKFPHNHYTTGINKRDEVNIENDSTWAEGEKIYFAGVKDNFGIKDPLPIQLPDHHANWLRLKGIKV